MSEEIILNFINQALADTHTACVAKITAVSGSTISAQPVVARVVDEKVVPLPVFPSVPVFTLQGGGSYLAMPIAVGDDCLLIFNERCLDNWYAGNYNVKALEERKHDYSDAIAFVGVNRSGTAIAIPSVITQIGDFFAQGEHEYNGNHVYNGDMTVNGDYTINGNLTVTGMISAGSYSGIGGGDMVTNSNIITTKDVKAGNISLQNHTHVDSIGGDTEKPE